MGGPRTQRKQIVENCNDLDTRHLENLARGTVNSRGLLTWLRVGSQLQVRYLLNVGDEDGTCRVLYTLVGTTESLDYRIRLTSTPCHLGGVRWWWECPLVTNRVACGRRVRKLYLRGKYFGCRHCHGLTYKSRRESDRKVREFLRSGVDSAKLCRPGFMSVSELLFASKVLAAKQRQLERHRV